MPRTSRRRLYVAELSAEIDQVLDWILDLKRQLARLAKPGTKANRIGRKQRARDRHR